MKIGRLPSCISPTSVISFFFLSQIRQLSPFLTATPIRVLAMFSSLLGPNSMFMLKMLFAIVVSSLISCCVDCSACRCCCSSSPVLSALSRSCKDCSLSFKACSRSCSSRALHINLPAFANFSQSDCSNSKPNVMVISRLLPSSPNLTQLQWSTYSQVRHVVLPTGESAVNGTLKVTMGLSECSMIQSIGISPLITCLALSQIFWVEQLRESPQK